jgi:hypothetical protein
MLMGAMRGEMVTEIVTEMSIMNRYVVSYALLIGVNRFGGFFPKKNGNHLLFLPKHYFLFV